jgi:hypothetical protein
VEKTSPYSLFLLSIRSFVSVSTNDGNCYLCHHQPESKLLVLDRVDVDVGCYVVRCCERLEMQKNNFENAPIDSICHSPTYRSLLPRNNPNTPTISTNMLVGSVRVGKMRKFYRKKNGPVYVVCNRRKCLLHDFIWLVRTACREKATTSDVRLSGVASTNDPCGCTDSSST